MDKELITDKAFCEAGSGIGNIADGFATRHRAMAKELNPLAETLRSINLGLRTSISDDFAKQSRALTLNITSIAQEAARVNRVLGQTVSPVAHAFAAIKLGSVLDKNGWFSHYTIPKDILTENQDNLELNDILIDYYRKNWYVVRQAIEQKLDTYLVDDEAKAAFRECLDAHENGFYRLVCRSSFPEVERVIRIEINRNNVGRLSVEKLMREHFDDLPISVFPDGQLGYIGYKQMTMHLYEQVNSEDDRQRFVGHQIPNRHASIHGLIPYSSVQASLNSISLQSMSFS